MEFQCSIGHRFKHYRLEKGLSQLEVAEGICSVSTVSHLETDRSVPSAKIMGLLAQRLGVPLSKIIGKQESHHGVDFQIGILRVYVEMGDLPRALEMSEELILHHDLLMHQQCEVITSRAECLLRADRFDDVVDLLISIVERPEARQGMDDENLCDIYNKLGSAYYKLRDFEKAYAAYEQGYRLSLKIPDFGPVAAKVTHNLGIACNTLGLKKDAIRYLEQAYRYYDSAKDADSLARSLFQLAISSGNETYLRKAHAIFESLNMIRDANLVRQHYSFHILSKSDCGKAVEELRATACTFQQIGDLDMSIYTYARAAMVSLKNGDIEEANLSFQLAQQRERLVETKSPYVMSYFYRVRAELDFGRSDFESCLIHSRKSSEIYAIMGMYADSADSLEISKRAYEQHGDIAAALRVSNSVIELLRQVDRRNEH